jgi:hypothetical protein
MSDMHRREYDYFDLKVSIDSEGDVEVELVPVSGGSLKVPWTIWLDMIEFAALSCHLGEEVTV